MVIMVMDGVIGNSAARNFCSCGIITQEMLQLFVARLHNFIGNSAGKRCRSDKQQKKKGSVFVVGVLPVQVVQRGLFVYQFKHFLPLSLRLTTIQCSIVCAIGARAGERRAAVEDASNDAVHVQKFLSY